MVETERAGFQLGRYAATASLARTLAGLQRPGRLRTCNLTCHLPSQEPPPRGRAYCFGSLPIPLATSEIAVLTSSRCSRL